MSIEVGKEKEEMNVVGKGGKKKKHMKGPRIKGNNQSKRIQIQVCSS